VPRHRTLDGAKQVLRFYRLGEKILRAFLDGAHGRRCVGVACQEHDWKRGAERVEAALQLRPAQAGYAHVKQDAAGLVLFGKRIEQLLRRRIGRDLVTGERQPPLDRGAEGRIVVNDMNAAARHPPSYAARGSVT
jgi:hypothetical protein